MKKKTNYEANDLPEHLRPSAIKLYCIIDSSFETKQEKLAFILGLSTGAKLSQRMRGRK